MEIPKPNPAQFTSMKNGLVKVGEEAKKVTPALEELGSKIKQNRQQGPGPRKPHLTHRPFVNPAVVTFRQGLDRSAKIKKK